MEAYYQKAEDGPQAATSLTFMTSSPTASPKMAVCLFHVTFPDLPQGMPLAV